MSLEDLIKVSKLRGINCLAITDHNTIEGAKKLREITDIKIIVGEEIKTKDGEINGYFLNEKIKPGMATEDTIKTIKEQGGLVCVPHPFDRLRSSALKKEVLNKVIDQVDLIEVYNSRNVFKNDNQVALEYALKHKKLITVGSDAHTANEVGNSFIRLDHFRNKSEMLKSLIKGEVGCKKSNIIVHFVTKYYKIKNNLA
jgi:predicted metal-dependent phosphoesterase TrpH